MLYAIESGAADGNRLFPPGTVMATWGRVGTTSKDKNIPPCSDKSSVTVSCRSVRSKWAP